MVIKAIRGMNDILPGEIARWRDLEQTSREVFELYGYSEIRTPVLEEAALFIRGIGKTTDIVSKQMYSFSDSKGRKLTLRPEETAPVLRAYLEHNLDKKQGFSKFYYIGPMFRSERPQSGRSRQFHQIGLEAIGSSSPYLDCEIISALIEVFKRLKLEGYILKLSSVGCGKCRPGFEKVLKNSLSGDVNLLCPDCQRRFGTNIFRILDCKNSNCRAVIRKAPVILDYLCKDCAEHFEKVKQGLKLLQINYKFDSHLVRGLDYYTKTTFEIEQSLLGSQNAIAAGGRYDDLSQELGGPQIRACGMSIGMERVLLALKGRDRKSPLPKKSVYLATVGQKAYDEGYRMLQKLRSRGVKTEIDYQARSLKAQLRSAGKLDCGYVVIIGEDELSRNKVILRDMKNGKQSEVKITQIINKVKELLND
ncbi:MAG: histidine--tRNA ligase [Candidatus Omnitrophota bacterium]|nr:histidine--tRNA ligase [Candidatus Omnitrophota bacterium]